MRALLRGALENAEAGTRCFQHEDGFTAGVPDTSFTRWGTTWLECKVWRRGVPEKQLGRGLQVLRMRQLAHFGQAWFVVWTRTASGAEFTTIAHPEEYHRHVGALALGHKEHELKVEFWMPAWSAEVQAAAARWLLDGQRERFGPRG